MRVDDIRSGGLYVDTIVDPFARCGPAQVEFANLLLNAIDGLVDTILGVRDVDAFVLPETIEVSVALVQRPAAVIHGIGVVVRDTLTAAIIELHFDSPGNVLRPALIRFALIAALCLSLRHTGDRGGERKQPQAESERSEYVHGIK